MPDFEALVDRCPDLFTVLDGDGTVRYQSAAVERVCGYAQTDLVGESLFEYVHPDDRHRISAALENADRESIDAPFEYRFRHADGTWIRLEAIDDPQPHPEADGYSIISRESGDRRERDRTLERYRVILDSLDDAVYAIESDGTIVHVNEAYASMKGADADDLLGTDIYEWASDSAIKRIRAAREKFEGDESGVGVAEYEFTTVSGDTIPVELRFSTVSRPGNELERVGVIRDVTERKAREQALHRKNERLEEFASIVSHDLRNPLNVAGGNLELAREECDSDRLNEVASAHDRMEALIDDLLTLARKGETVTETGAIDLEAAVERGWRSVATENATLVVNADRTIVADRSRFQQLVENLVHNAVEHGSTSPDSQARRNAVEHGSTSPDSQARRDASEDGGPGVTVTVGELDDGFFVQDDGTGISDERRDRVFESGYSTAIEGTGYGLGIVEGVVDAHGWSIAVAEGTAGGARFEITGLEFAD